MRFDDQGERVDELDSHTPEARGPSGGRVLATAAAALALMTGIGVAVVSIDDMDPTPPPASPAPATASPSSERPEHDEDDETPFVPTAKSATVYDSAGDVRECATSRGDFPAPGGAAGFDDDIARVSRSVERIRSLRFRKAVDTRVVSAEEVGRRFARSLAREYTPLHAAADERVLGALGLVPDGADLYSIAVDLAEGTAAGFYNPRKKRLFSRTTAGVLTPFDEVVLAHEIDHALVDQTLRLPRTLSKDPMLGDVMMAHQALAEGDATLAMSQYGAGTLDQAALVSFLARFSSPTIPGYPGVPYFLQRTSGFPYYEGLLFACRAWKQGGWRAIDKMYGEPPSSTAEIIFPSRYRQRAAGELPPAPPTPGRRWTEFVRASFGAFDLMLMLENADVLSTGDAVAGSHVDDVRGWNGGVLNAWTKGAGTTVHLGLVDAGVVEDGRRRRKLCGVLRRWARRTFPSARSLRGDRDTWVFEDGYGGLRCAGASVRVAVGPRERAVRSVLRP